jgi:hypothetical protein
MPGGKLHEDDPFILRSEHRRVLASAQERYDRNLELEEKIGFWRGVSHSIWLMSAAVAFAGVAGFLMGVAW